MLADVLTAKNIVSSIETDNSSYKGVIQEFKIFAAQRAVGVQGLPLQTTQDKTLISKIGRFSKEIAEFRDSLYDNETIPTPDTTGDKGGIIFYSLVF